MRKFSAQKQQIEIKTFVIARLNKSQTVRKFPLVMRKLNFRRDA